MDSYICSKSTRMQLLAIIGDFQFVIIPLFIAAIALPIWAIINMLTDDNSFVVRLLWFAVVVSLPILGSLLYLYLEREKKRAKVQA